MLTELNFLGWAYRFVMRISHFQSILYWYLFPVIRVKHALNQVIKWSVSNGPRQLDSDWTNTCVFLNLKPAAKERKWDEQDGPTNPSLKREVQGHHSRWSDDDRVGEKIRCSRQSSHWIAALSFTIRRESITHWEIEHLIGCTMTRWNGWSPRWTGNHLEHWPSFGAHYCKPRQIRCDNGTE